MSQYGWDWRRFKGTPECLKYNLRDLEHLDAAIKLAGGRRAAVQAGGNLGIFPKRLAQSFGAVYTFEPATDLFRIMVHNAPESNIHRFNAAVGYDRKMVGTIRTRPPHKEGRPIHEGITRISGDGNVPTLRIDDLALMHCDLIYLDVEGWEFFALRGAEDTIKRCRPVIGLEINDNLEAASGITRDELQNYMRTLGYQPTYSIRSDVIFTRYGA